MTLFHVLQKDFAAQLVQKAFQVLIKVSFTIVLFADFITVVFLG